MGETCPQYLFFTDDYLMRSDGAKWVCSPPLRTAADSAALWQALADGSIQSVGTDHCPFFFDGTTPIDYEGRSVAIAGKELGQGDFTLIPNGLPGIEHRLPLLWTFGVGAGSFSAERFVELTAVNPAKILGLYPRKGALLPGSDADIVLWDPGKKHTHCAHAHRSRPVGGSRIDRLSGKSIPARTAVGEWRAVAGQRGWWTILASASGGAGAVKPDERRYSHSIVPGGLLLIS